MTDQPCNRKRRLPRATTARHELSGVASATSGDALSTAVHHSRRAAVSVLLDGADVDQADEQLIDMDKFNPFWVVHPTFKHISKLLFETQYPRWLWNTMYVAVGATTLSIIASVLAAYAIVRLRFKGADAVGILIFFAYLVPPSILFIPLASVIQAYGLFDSPLSLILVYPTLLIPFSTWLLMGYFKTIPYELEECALIDGASRWQILVKIVVPLAIPGLISAFIFSFTLCWNEFIYALTFLQSTPNKTVPGGDRERVCRRRYLQVGIADGRRAGRLAAAGDPLRVLCRALRVGDDRSRERVSARGPAA